MFYSFGPSASDFCPPSWCRRRPRPSISLVLFWFALAGSCVFRRRRQGQTPFPSIKLTPAVSNRAKSLAMVIDVHTLRVFDRRRFLSRTPGWSAFVNSTPAASRACLITLSVDRRCSPLPASNKRMVATPTPAASASCCWFQSIRPRAALHWAEVSILTYEASQSNSSIYLKLFDFPIFIFYI
jgi:hypothetical protein